MIGTNLCVNKSEFVPVIFEPPCIMAIAKSCTFRGSNSDGDENSLLYKTVRSPSNLMCDGTGTFPEVKRSERDTDHTPASSAGL